MCGICGVIQIHGEARQVVPDHVLDRMNDAMEHRGPNDHGTHVSPGASIGARRLSIIDVEGGHQPFSNEDGTIWAVQNGELYNHASIRDDLRRRGHTFASRCDTEILPHLYEEYGPMFPEQLRGMFGIAVWDQVRRRGVIARDRLGIKPIYYAVCGDSLVFASELKSLLASGLVPSDLDYEAIDTFLSLGFFPAPATPLAAVKKLEPGCILVIENGAVEERRFWSYPQPTLERGGSVEEWSERLIAELEESVRMRLMADVPLGAMLSGGLDSSLIVALMAKQMDRPVDTFAVGFKEAGASNELADARFVADVLGANHHELELSFAEETISLERLVWHLDEPVADLSSLGFIALSELAAQHVTVALSGQGADELLGGYRKHRAAAIADLWKRVPSPLRRVALAAASHGPSRMRRPISTLAAPGAAERLLSMSGALTGDMRQKLVRGPLAELDGNAALRAISYRLGDLPDAPLPATLFLDGQLGLADDMLHYFDRASMAHSLEVRVPFLDHHFVALCASMPANLKVHRKGRSLETKHVLKHAARGLVPDRIIDKPKIGFFNAAVDGWFRAQTRGAISDYLLGPNPRYAEMLDRGEVEKLVKGQADGAGGNTYVLLSVLMLEVWLSEYLPRAQAGASAPALPSRLTA
jgi:asparagine synthase (glutamine-hydrolysing)